MATKKPVSESRALANWDEELAKQALAAAQTEASVSTGNFFGTKSGVLSWNDAPLKNNEMVAVILDTVLENVFYGSDYDPENPQGPQCFAFGRGDAEMSPHEVVVANGTAVHETCKGCPNNEFGSAERGRGKACRNIRRLGLIPGGLFDNNGKFVMETDLDAFKSAQLGFLKIPVTSVKGYAAFVKQLAASLKRPPLGVFTKIKVTPDADSQFKVTFEALGLVPNTHMAIVMERRAEASATIDSPYSMEAKEKPVRGPASRKGVVPAKGKRKY